jgi:hypothetical protein
MQKCSSCFQPPIFNRRKIGWWSDWCTAAGVHSVHSVHTKKSHSVHNVHSVHSVYTHAKCLQLRGGYSCISYGSTAWVYDAWRHPTSGSRARVVDSRPGSFYVLKFAEFWRTFSMFRRYRTASVPPGIVNCIVGDNHIMATWPSKYEYHGNISRY